VLIDVSTTACKQKYNVCYGLTNGRSLALRERPELADCRDYANDPSCDGATSKMSWHIHPFMKKPSHAHFLCFNLIQHEVMFDGKTAAARIPIVTRLTQSGIGGKLP